MSTTEEVPHPEPENLVNSTGDQARNIIQSAFPPAEETPNNKLQKIAEMIERDKALRKASVDKQKRCLLDDDDDAATHPDTTPTPPNRQSVENKPHVVNLLSIGRNTNDHVQTTKAAFQNTVRYSQNTEGNDPNPQTNTLSISPSNPSKPEYPPEKVTTANAVSIFSKELGLSGLTMSSPTPSANTEHHSVFEPSRGATSTPKSKSARRKFYVPSSYRPDDKMKSFPHELASAIGIKAATVLGLIALKALSLKNEHLGRKWYYDGVKTIQTKLDYLTVNEIRGALVKGVREGLIITGNFNRKGYDQTKWYSPEPRLIEAIGGPKLYFSAQDARRHGIDEAVLLNHLYGKRDSDGADYVVRPVVLSHYLPMSAKRINKALRSLHEKEIL